MTIEQRRAGEKAPFYGPDPFFNGLLAGDATAAAGSSKKVHPSKTPRYSGSAMREAYRMLLAEIRNEEKCLALVARSCGISALEAKRILNAPPAPPPTHALKEVEAQPVPGRASASAAIPRKDMTTRLLKPPKPAAMLAFKQFALRNESANATILAVVHVPDGPLEPVEKVLERSRFKVLARYSKLSAAQQSILDYVATVLETHPARLCCGAQNVVVEGAEEKIGHISSPCLPVHENRFDALVAPARRMLASLLPQAALHYLSLPPLDLSRLQGTVQSILLERKAAQGTRTVPTYVDRREIYSSAHTGSGFCQMGG